MNDFEKVEDYEEFASLIGVGFLDAMKYAYASGEITEEIHSAITDCIEDMKECIKAYDYYSNQYKK